MIVFKTKEDLAMHSIEYYLSNKKEPQVKKEQVDKSLWPQTACFVTLYLNNNLRGCVGDYIPKEALYVNIIKNAINAAFFDFRFAPLQKEELSMLKISVSVLSPISKLSPANTSFLIEFLKKKKPGLLIEKNGRKALFLPEVWKELSDPISFLEHLSLKAGLSTNSWQEKDMKYWIFKTKD